MTLPASMSDANDRGVLATYVYAVHALEAAGLPLHGKARGLY